MKNHFPTFLRTIIGDREHREFAALCGIAPSQLSKILHGQPPEKATLAKIISGVSEKGVVRAECLAAYLRDLLPLAGEAGKRVRIDVVTK